MKSDFKEVKQWSEILDITERAIQKWVSSGKIDDDYLKKTPSPGHKGYKLLISGFGLPEPYRSKYIRKQSQADPDPHREEIDMELYAELKDYQKEHVDLWMNLFQKFDGLKGQELKHALSIYKEENPDVSCSYKTFLRKKKEYDEMGIAGIAPGWGKREGDSKIDDNDFELFKGYYLKESRPNLHSCWELVRGAAYEAGRDVSDFPHPKTFKRRLENEMPESAIYLARYGESAWKRKYANYADRDKSSITAGSCWVSDHRQLDQFVYNDEGKPYRPWCTAWMDFKSGKWLSWYMHEEAPNSDHIFQSFKWAVEKFGKPDDIYLDNGKDYRCKDFAGGTSYHKVSVDERKTRSMIGMLNITPHFAIPYNAQAKNIEPAFRAFIEYLEKHMPGYAGSNAQERPDITQEQINRGEILHDQTLYEMFDRFIDKVLNRKVSRGKEHNGLSANELFFKEFKEKQAVRPEALKIFCMRTSNDVTIMRNGALDSSIGHRYWADWMAGMKGTKVYLRRDIKKYDEAWVFDAKTDEYIGMAYMDVTINGLVNNDVDRKQLRDKQSQKRREKKLIKAYTANLETPDPEEILLHAIANQDAEEEMRKASGDFLDYTEDVKVNRMTDTKADEIVNKEREMRKTGTDDLEEIAPDDKDKNSKLNSIWDE